MRKYLPEGANGLLTFVCDGDIAWCETFYQRGNYSNVNLSLEINGVCLTTKY